MNQSVASQNISVVAGIDSDILVKKDSSTVHYSDSKKFIADIPKLFKNVQGVIFNVFEYQPNGYASNMDFCKAVKEKMDSLQIQYYFDSLLNCIANGLLIATKVTAKFHELVYIIIVSDNDANVVEYEYTENGYKEISENIIPIDIKENPKLIRDKILGTTNPKKIILTIKNPRDNKAIMKCLRVALKSKKLIVYDNFNYTHGTYFNEIEKWFMDKSYTKYYILPTCARNYFLKATRGKVFIPIVTLQGQELLPYKHYFCLPGLIDKVTFGDVAEEASHRSISLEEKCHEYKVTVTIDVNNFLDVKCEAITYDGIRNLPKALDEKFEKGIPVIGILNNLSVICLPKDDGYEFFDAWNGLYGKELIISFEEEKPKFCCEITPENKTFLVYDLIDLMRLPVDEIFNNKNRYFTITKDAEHPVLLEFDIFDGTKKAASPAFLMAMLLKQHLKAIKKETGEKPTQIGICLLQPFDEDERKRVEEQLKESCKLLKINCAFVNV